MIAISFHLPRRLMFRILAYRLQAERLGELDQETVRLLYRIASGNGANGARSVLGKQSGRDRTAEYVDNSLQCLQRAQTIARLRRGSLELDPADREPFPASNV